MIPVTFDLKVDVHNQWFVHISRHIGETWLYYERKRLVKAAHETHDLLGTEVLRRFSEVKFSIASDKRMELN